MRAPVLTLMTRRVDLNSDIFSTRDTLKSAINCLNNYFNYMFVLREAFLTALGMK